MADQTFSIDPGAPVTPARQDQPALVRLASSSQGVNVSGGGVDTATMDAMLKLGSDILAPRVKAAAQEQFLEGVQQAATGEALTDIVRDRPWYSEIFGPSSAVQGARAYTIAQKVAKFGADMEAKMPSLASQGPEAITEQLAGLRQEVMTGDEAADMAITAQIVDQMAPLYKRHAKEHYAYVQQQASDAQVSAWTTLGAAYQQRAMAQARGDMVSPEDVQADADRLLGNMNPFADQGDDSYEKNVTQFLEASATAGNFHVVKLFKDRGLYDKLRPNARATLDRHLRAAGNQTLANVTPEFALDIAMFVNDTAQDPRGIPERAAKLNAKASAVTGVPLDVAQLIPNGSVDQIAGRVLVAQANADRSAQEKAAEDALKLSTAKVFLDQPDGAALCKATKACQEGYVERAALERWGSLNPAQRGALLSAHPSETFLGLKSRLSGVLNGKEDTPGVQSTAATWAAMSPGAQAQYFSDDENRFLRKYTDMVAANESPAAAYQAAKIVTPLSKTYLDAKDKGEMASALRATVETANENFFGWNYIPDGQMRVYEAVLGDTVKNRTFGDVETSARAALGEAQAQQRITRMGKFAVLGSDPTQPRIETILGGKIGFNAAGDTFTTLVEEGVKAIGGDDADSSVVLRLPDINGVAQWQVLTYQGSTPRSFRLNSDMLIARDTADRAKPEFQPRRDGRSARVPRQP